MPWIYIRTWFRLFPKKRERERERERERGEREREVDYRYFMNTTDLTCFLSTFSSCITPCIAESWFLNTIAWSDCVLYVTTKSFVMCCWVHRPIDDVVNVFNFCPYHCTINPRNKPIFIEHKLLKVFWYTFFTVFTKSFAKYRNK